MDGEYLNRTCIRRNSMAPKKKHAFASPYAKFGIGVFFLLLGVVLATHLLTVVPFVLWSADFLYLVLAIACIGIGATFIVQYKGE